MKLSIILGGALLLSSSIAFADNSNRGWFAGVGFGSANYRGDSSLDNTDSMITGFGGYRFNNHLAIQGNVVDLGEYGDGDSVIKSIELKGISATAVGIIPISNSGIELFGRAGLAIIKYTQKVEFLGVELESSSTGNSIVAALGASYTPQSFDKLSFIASYDYYYFETSKAYDNEDNSKSHSIGVLGLGVRFNF